MEDSSANEASLTILGGAKSGLRFVIEDSVAGTQAGIAAGQLRRVQRSP